MPPALNSDDEPKVPRFVALTDEAALTPEVAQMAARAIEAASATSRDFLRCPEDCDEGWVLGSRSWLACSLCHGSGKRGVLGEYVPGTRRKKTGG